MTYTGKGSRGCETCRKIHVKCDEKRPECSRCIRLKRVCYGYRDETDLIFRMESGASKTKSSRKESLRKPEGCPSSLSLPRSLFPSQDEQVLCYFYESTIGTMSESDHSRYLHLQLPALLSRTRQDSALYFAAQAISHAVFARSRGNHGHTMRVSRKRYVQSISALKAAIQDPIEVKSDESLYAVFLLGGYETITFDTELLSAWGSHVDGAAALLRVRGKEQLSTRLQCYMFLFARRNAIHSHVQLSQPVDSIFAELAESVCSYENTEDRLLSSTIKVPQLQSFANDLLSQPNWSITESDTWELIHAAEDLNHELATWASHAPLGWSYSVATNLNVTSNPELPASSYIPSEIHDYPDFYVARVWNLYRVSRLIIQSILLRASSYLNMPLQNNGQQLETTHIDKLNGVLVSEICASVPFLLGYDLSQLKRPTKHINFPDGKSIWPQNSVQKSHNAKHTGRFSLIWPLYLSCSVGTISDLQKGWMRAQLHWIAKDGADGAPQADLISRAQSQTLLGRPEEFRFDCV